MEHTNVKKGITWQEIEATFDVPPPDGVIEEINHVLLENAKLFRTKREKHVVTFSISDLRKKYQGKWLASRLASIYSVKDGWLSDIRIVNEEGKVDMEGILTIRRHIAPREDYS